MAAFKTLILTKPMNLSVQNRALLIHSDDERLSFSFDDLESIIIENPAVRLSVAVLQECARSGVALISCDQRHLPISLSMPLFGHWKQSAIAKAQIACPQNIQHALWGRIICAKIINQSIASNCPRTRKILYSISQRSRSDIHIDEARAARIYWSRFSLNFSRKPSKGQDWFNQALDYGYAILLGHMARAIVGAGLIPQLGLFHRSRTNDFNLASDLMEPFRPFVDKAVLSLSNNSKDQNETLSKTDRQSLALLGNMIVLYKNKPNKLCDSVSLVANSLREAMISRDASLLELPMMQDHDHVDLGTI